MGYELNIQRENNENKISINEWADYMNSDSEFESIEEFSADLKNGKVLTVSTPNAGIWESKNGEVPFTFSEEYGWITVKNPDNLIIEKMISIAKKLNAVVVGEEGEEYDEQYLKKGFKGLGSANKKWWEFWE
jgi:hypothetical protein